MLGDLANLSEWSVQGSASAVEVANALLQLLLERHSALPAQANNIQFLILVYLHTSLSDATSHYL